MTERADAGRRRTRTPPGPERELSVQEIRTKPLEFVAALVREYGDIVRYRAPGWHATLVSRPSYVKHVLLDNFSNYGKEGTPDLMMLKPMLGNGLLTSDGEEWQRQRHMLHPFFQRQRVEQFAGWIVEAGRDMLDRWAMVEPGTILEMTREMATLTLRIVARALFGYDVVDEADAFGRAVNALNEAMGHPDVHDETVGRKYREALHTIRSTVHRVVLERLVAVSSGNDTLASLINHSRLEGGDVLSSEALMDQVLTLLLAGHETTAKAFCWALYLLSEHPDTAERMREEANAVFGGGAPAIADLPRLSFSHALIQETLRLYPPIWLMSRKAALDDVIDDYGIPAGGLVVFSPFLLNRREDLWAEPDQFRPERFLNADERIALSSYSYLPFGGGPRQCIGRQFATLELRLLLPMICQRFSVALVPGHPVEPEALVTLRPRYGLPMTVRAAS